MLNLQKVIQELKAQKMNLVIDREITAGLGRLSMGSARSVTSNASWVSGVSGASNYSNASGFSSR